MSRLNFLFLSLIMIMALSGGDGNNGNAESSQTPAAQIPSFKPAEDESPSENILIAYFGRMGNTDFPDDVDATASASLVSGKEDQLQGTTESMAHLIQENVGGDLHLIQTAEAYPADYDTVVAQNHCLL